MEAKGSFMVNMTNKVTLPDVDYINDIAVEKNFSLGRSFIDPPKILSDLYYIFQKENEDPLAFDIKDHLFSSDFIEDNILMREMNSSELAYYNYTLLFLEKIEFTNVLGMTPLDKSLNVLMYLTHLSENLSKESEKKGNYSWGNGDSDPKGNGHIEIKDEEALADAMKGMAGGVNPGDLPGAPQPGGDESGSNKPGEIKKEMTSCVRDHLYDLTPSIAHIYGKKKPADVPINKKILTDIKIKAYLEETSGLDTAFDEDKEKNNDSHEKDTFKMETVDEVTKVRKSSMMLENFDDKLIKKELNIRTKVKPKNKKQILYMLLDDSGSMANLAKQTYVRAVLLNRLESVIDGKSELKFALYESQRYEFSEVKTKLEAQNLFRKISLRRPSGGGTYIGSILQETINEIHSDTTTGYHDPEIMIVCDGDDHVNPKNLDYKDVRINVVLLGTTNKGLEKVAKDTGGFFTVEKMYNRY
tara:strand:- start:1678 stop:3090 length:1413 start_codon:yes stop_codon:yes gene_type:complete